MKTLLKGSVAALIIAVSAYGAVALNNDQNRTFPVRQLQSQQANYVRFTINYNDPNISTAQKFITLPQNAFIVRTLCQVTTAFNAGSTNVIIVGGNATTNDLIASTGANRTVTPGTLGLYDITSAASLGNQVTSGGDVTLSAKYTQTGGAATAGAMTCAIEYMPNNDM